MIINRSILPSSLIFFICINLIFFSISKSNSSSVFIDSSIESEIETKSNFNNKNNKLDYNNILDNLFDYSTFILIFKFSFTISILFSHITEVLTSPPNFVKK